MISIRAALAVVLLLIVIPAYPGLGQAPIYPGATWTRDMRNLMIIAFGTYLAIWWLTLPLGNTGLWIAILVFFGARGALQAARYPALVKATFSAIGSSSDIPLSTRRD